MSCLHAQANNQSTLLQTLIKLKVIANDYISGGVIQQISQAKTRGEGARDLARD